MLFKWVISSWGWREDRRKLYQSKIRFLRLKRVRIWCQWLRYSGTRLCCASGRSVIDLGSCCQLELGVDCLFSIGVDFIFLVFCTERKKGYTSIQIEYLQCVQSKSYLLFRILWTYNDLSKSTEILSVSSFCFIGYFRFKSKFAISGLYLPVNVLCFKPPFVTLKWFCDPEPYRIY